MAEKVAARSTDPSELKGKSAPKFTLPDQVGEPISLAEIDEEFIVLFFYPKDNTPGCTIEAREFSKDLKRYRARNTRVLGISGGDQKSKAKFVEKCALKVQLLSDTEFATAGKYKVFGEKSFMGRKFMGICRTTFILDKNRKIAHVFNAVKPLGHSSEVLAVLKRLQDS